MKSKIIGVDLRRYLQEILLTQPKRHLAVWAIVTLFLLYLVADLRPSFGIEDLYPPDALQQLHLQKKISANFGDANRLLVIVDPSLPLQGGDSQKMALLVEDLAKDLADNALLDRIDYRLSPTLQRFQNQQMLRQILLHFDQEQLQQLNQLLNPEFIRQRLGQIEGGGFWQQDRFGRFSHRDPLSLYSLVRPTLNRLSGDSPLRYTGNSLLEEAQDKHGLPIAEATEMAPRYLTDRQGDRRFLLLQPRSNLNDFNEAKEFVNQVDHSLRTVMSRHADFIGDKQINIFATGRPYVYVEGFDALKVDAKQNIIQSLLIIFFLFALTFYRPVFALVSLLPIALSIFATLLLGKLFFGHVHLLTMVFCVLLVGLGIDFALHIGAHFWTYKQVGHSVGPMAGQPTDKRSRLLYCLTTPFSGILFSSLTTMVAFFSLTISGYPVIRQTGLLIGIGIGLVCLFYILFMPPLLSIWPQPEKVPPFVKERGVWQRFFTLLTFLQSGRRWPGLLLWGVLIVGATFGVMRLRFETHPWSILIRGNQQATVLQKLHDSLQASFSPILLVSTGDTREEAIANDRQAYQALYKKQVKSQIAAMFSLSNLLPPLPQQEVVKSFLETHRDRLQPQVFWRNYQQAIEQHGLGANDYLSRVYPQKIVTALEIQQPVTITTLEEAGLAAEVGRFNRQIDGTWYSVSYLYPKQFPWVKGALTPLMREWQSSQLDGQTTLVGEALRALGHQKTLRQDALRISLLAFLAVFALLFFHYRKWQPLIQSLLPLLCGCWLLLGIMGFLGIELNFLTLAVVPILFGAGVDNGIHITERLRRGEPIANVFREVGPGMIMASLTTSAAFFTLLSTHYRGIHDFGLCGGLGIAICLATALHLVPLLNRQ